jgi:hypothetical protein
MLIAQRQTRAVPEQRAFPWRNRDSIHANDNGGLMHLTMVACDPVNYGFYLCGGLARNRTVAYADRGGRHVGGRTRRTRHLARHQDHLKRINLPEQ